MKIEVTPRAEVYTIARCTKCEKFYHSTNSRDAGRWARKHIESTGHIVTATTQSEKSYFARKEEPNEKAD